LSHHLLPRKGQLPTEKFQLGTSSGPYTPLFEETLESCLSSFPGYPGVTNFVRGVGKGKDCRLSMDARYFSLRSLK